jgi:hypothetical protein
MNITDNKMKSKKLSDCTCSAIIDHDNKTLKLTIDGVSDTVNFTEYDEWAGFNIGDYNYDVHIHFDENLGVSFYGLHYLQDGETIETDIDNESFVDFKEIGTMKE